MEQGCVAVAMVQRQVMVVRSAHSLDRAIAPAANGFVLPASRSQKQREHWLDVHTFTPLGNRVFLPSPVPQARISSSDILSIFPTSDKISFASGMLELPPQAYSEYIELSSRMQEKYERLFAAMAETRRVRRR